MPRLGVAADARALGAHLERAERPQLYGLSTLQSAANFFKRRFDYALCLDAGQAGSRDIHSMQEILTGKRSVCHIDAALRHNASSI